MVASVVPLVSMLLLKAQVLVPTVLLVSTPLWLPRVSVPNVLADSTVTVLEWTIVTAVLLEHIP